MSRQILALLIVVSAIGPAARAQGTLGLTMQDVMSVAELQQSGVYRLTPAERAALDRWLNRYTLRALSIAKTPTPPTAPSSNARAREYVVEASVNDETFIINGELFKAKTYCFGLNQGDRVLFIEGSANGVCTSAMFVNVRTGRECRVWCE